jgi:uncharacterized protein (TIGR02001 family)
MITMITKKMGLVKGVVGALAISLLAAPAMAQGLKDGPMTPARALEWTANFAVTSDYVFRGFSQSAEKPAAQAGVDLTYGIFYAGVWGSGIDFGNDGAGRNIATAEVDLVAGIKPKWGPLSFDFGVIYYIYPGARDPGAQLDYVEVKAGVSYEPWKGATVGSTVFYSPEYTGKTGDVWTFESSFAQELPKFGPVTPTFSALLGYQTGDSAAYSALIGQGGEYYYWNAGVSFAFAERFSIDVRYWGTDNSDAFCDAFGKVLNCGDRVVATAKVTF